jgi:hypothetical protein
MGDGHGDGANVAVLDQDLFQRIDLPEARLDVGGRRQLADSPDQHVLVVRAVEDADEAASRRGEVGAPQEIVRQLFFARSAEGCDVHSERAGCSEYEPDGPVLACGIYALKDHQQRALALGVQAILQLVDRLGVAPALSFGAGAVRKRRCVVRVAPVEPRTLAGPDQEFRREVLRHTGPRCCRCHGIIGRRPASVQRVMAIGT